MARTPSVCLALSSVAAAIAGMAAIAAAPPAAAEPGGVFSTIFSVFGSQHDGRYAPATAYAAPTAPATPPDKGLELQAPAMGGNTYCVRLCDGRYFPLSAPAVSSPAGPARMCSALCPAAKTALFRGEDIDNAFGARGERYADLANAFVYRRELVPDCTCNGRDGF